LKIKPPPEYVGGTIGFAEGTGGGIGMIGHQIGHQRRKSTVRKFGGAPEDRELPRICGNCRANAAGWKEFRIGKFLGAAF